MKEGRDEGGKGKKRGNGWGAKLREKGGGETPRETPRRVKEGSKKGVRSGEKRWNKKGGGHPPRPLV